MLWKGLILLLLVCSACSGTKPRVKRTFGSLFSSSSNEEKKPLPVYKVHRYTGIHIVPVDPKHAHGPHKNNENLAAAPDIVELPDSQDQDDYDDSSDSAFGALSSLIPLGSGILSGALGASGGGFQNREMKKLDDRIGIAVTKEWIKSLPAKKKEFVLSALTGAVGRVTNKASTVKGLIKGAFKGPKTSVITNGVYKYVPYDGHHHSVWSKIPLVGRFFKTEIPLEIPDVGLPHWPHLVAFEDAPGLPIINIKGHYELPFKTGAYVKIKVPHHNNYEIPSTSYGVPDGQVSFPDLPEDIEDSEPNYKPLPGEGIPNEPTTLSEKPTAPEYVPPLPPVTLPQEPPVEFNVAPYPPAGNLAPYPPATQSAPYPPAGSQAPPQPVFTTFPYPQSSFPYPPSGYYQKASASERHIATVEPERPVYRQEEEEPQPVSTVAQLKEQDIDGRKDDLPSNDDAEGVMQLEDGDIIVKERIQNPEIILAEEIPEDRTETSLTSAKPV